MSRREVLYINGRFLTQELTGVQRYATEIVKAIDQHLAAQPVESRLRCVLLAPKGASPVTLQLDAVAFQEGGIGSGHVWEQVSLPVLARGGRLLNLGNSGPVLHRRALTVIHDAIVYRMPERFSRPYRTLHQTLGRWLARYSRIATVSEFSRGELSAVLGVPSGEIVIAPNGGNHIARTTPDTGVLATLGVERNQYFLFVGSPAPHKNLAMALEAFSFAAPEGMRFVIVGAAKAKVFGDGLTDVPENVVVAGRLTDEEIAALYENAAAFVFPSLYEGFGIPPLEAMVHNCPVLASAIPSCIEVCADAALFFDPQDISALAHLLGLVADGEVDRDALIAAGHRRAETFSWAKSAQYLLEAILNQYP